jgi:hypothetical protein
MEEWFWGIYATGMGDANIDGSIDLNANKLPWIKDADNVEEDINCGDTATIAIAKKYMTDWATKLKVGRNSLVCVDMDPNVAWNSGKKIKFYGVITKLNPKHKEHLTIKADNQLAIFNRQVTCDLFDAESTKPSDGVTFEASTQQGLMGNIVRHGFNTAAAPAGQRPANILGTVSGVSTGNTYSLKTLHSENKSIGALLINYRDNVSRYGNEFRFLPVFTSSSMNLIRLNTWIGEDSVAGAHLNESQVVTINIETPDQFNKMVEMSVVHNLDGVATRWIVHTKTGDETTDSGSDLYAKSNTTTDLPRLDAFLNPGVELTTAERDAQAAAHLAGSASFAEATFSVEEDFKTDWKDNLGKTINFVGGAGTEYAEFNMTVRCISLGWSASNGSVNVGLVVPQPRYPLLPKDRQRGKTGSDFGSPIVAPKNPNVPKPGGGGGFPTFPTDDWDKPKLGEDTPTDINIPVGMYYDYMNRHTIWEEGVEGHTIIADDANSRFLGLNYAHMLTMWPDKPARGSLRDLIVSKSRKFSTRPQSPGNGNMIGWGDPASGLTGSKGDIMTLNWATISASALPGTLAGYALTHEIFNFTLSLYGKVSERTVMVTAHQLQLFSGSADNKIRSKDFSFKVTVNDALDLVSGVTPTTDTPYKGNAVYDADWTFYAYGNQIGCDTSGDIENCVILTPRAYPVEGTIPKPGGTGYDNNYWASINQGAYATWNIAIVKDWMTGQNDSSGGPSVIGKDYRQVTFLQIPWIDQSRVINNTFACTVIGSTVYADSMTAYGKATEGKTTNGADGGEHLITKATFETKPNKGLSSWQKLHSGIQAKGNTAESNLLVMNSSWKRNKNEIALREGDDYWDQAILVKDGVDAVRRMPRPVGYIAERPLSFSWSGSTIKDGFSDFYDFSTGTGYGAGKWLTSEYFDYGIFLWNPYSGMQMTAGNKSLRCSNFTVNVTTVNSPGTGYSSISGGTVYWSWEL